MKNNVLIDGITNIDNELIERYFILKNKFNNKSTHKLNKYKIIKWSSIAAAFCVIFVVATVCFSLSLNENRNPTYDYIERPYNMNTIIQVNEAPIVLPWEYKTVWEKYIYIDIDGVRYFGHKQEVNESFIGKKLGAFTATGYDALTAADDRTHHESFECYEITDVAANRLIAVKMNEKYYAFETEIYSPPESFGTFLDEYGLINTIELKKLKYIDENQESDNYILADDGFVLSIFAECRTAEAVNPIGWHEIKRDGVKFSLDSEHYGITNKTIFITSDGYLWTDMFNGEYLYYIGDTASEEIIAYSTDNSSQQKVLKNKLCKWN